MSKNIDTLRRNLGTAAAALVLLAGGATQAVAQHNRGDARPPSSSSSSSPSVRPSSGDSSRSSTSSRSGSSDGAASTRPSGGSGSPTRIDNDSRSHRYRGGHYGGGHYYGGYGYGGYYGYGPRWGWYGVWNSPWYWGYPYGGAVTVYPNGQYGNLGALDLDVAPERAEVYIDGQRVGVADDFDGFPTYLWLEQGTYDVVFYMSGFRTLARQYTIYPGLIIDVEDTLEPGEAVRPEDLPAKTHERRDARIRDDRERERQYEQRGDRPRPVAPRGDWRERNPGAVIQPRAGDEQSRDLRGEPGSLRLRIEPSDASVYLDGRFIGTAETLSDLRSGLIVDAGAHRLEVVRPGWRSETRSFQAAAGEDVELEIELEEQ
jgi:hypothetical protein